MTTTRTRRNRAVTGAVTSLAALMMLTGCQSSSSGDGGLGSSDTSTSSSSSGASASKSTKSKSASASPSASPSATGTQVVQIGGPDVPDTEDASVKAAFETVQQLIRLQNAWGEGAEIAPSTSEDLKKFLGGEAYQQMDKLQQDIIAAAKAGEKPSHGEIRVGWLGTDNAGEVFGEGFRHEHGSIQMRVCEDWSQVKNPDGSLSFPPEKSKRTMRASVERRADGQFYLISYRVDHYGCN